MLVARWQPLGAVARGDQERHTGLGQHHGHLRHRTRREHAGEPALTGHTFTGWNTAANESGSTFTRSTRVTADVTV